MSEAMNELVEQYIDKISSEKNVSPKEAAELIDKCIRRIALDQDIDYQEAYSTIYSPEYLSKCVLGKCDKMTVEQCYESCHCAVYNDQCISREIENVELINRDPDKFAQGLHSKALENLVEKAAFLYFNYEGGGLTDNAYDALEYHLNKRLKLKERRREKVGAPPIKRIRTTLPYLMPSLEKIKPGTKGLETFLNKCNASDDKEIVWSDKLDGVSGLVVYKGGKITGVYVRGDGIEGGDVTFVKDYIDFPKLDGDYAIRGEFVIEKRTFYEKYSDNYSNPRSFVTSKINSGFVSPMLVDIDFVAYSIIDGKRCKPSKVFKQLDVWGFKTPANGLFENCVLTFELMMLYKKRREESVYKIDGLVLTVNDDEADTKAFKMLLEEQIRETKITNIDWNISRHGRYVPVAIYESVFIDDVRLHRASAFNAAHVRDWSMGKGTKIKIARSGDVIPHINDVEVDINIIPIYPDEERGEWHWERSDIVLNEVDSNKWVQIKRISYFFEVIGVPGIREGTVKTLWEYDFNTIEKLTQAKPEDLIKVKGIGKKKSQDFYKNIHEVMRKTRLDRFLAATTTFKSSIGRKLIIRLMSKYPNVINDDPETIRKHLSKKENKIPGFGPKRIESVARDMKNFREFLYSLNEDDVKHAIEYNQKRIKTIVKNPLIDGKKFVLTGFMKTNYELEDYIYDHGGDIIGSVTSDTEAVISNNILEISKKMISANELGVNVYSMSEFANMFKTPDF